MNYLEIVLHGYFNENNREFLDKYFFREFKKAEKEHFFEADEFFNGCLKIVDILKENYKKQYIEIQSELNKYLVSVKKEDRDNEFIQQQKEEIEYLKLNGNTNFRLNNGKNVVLKIEEISYIQNAIEQALKKTQPEIEHSKPQPIIESPFSVFEWATIFYYADETKLLSESRFLKTRLEQFMSKHQVNTTPVNFKNSYYEAKRRINEKNDYPINKLELIIPFLKENYKQTVTKVENDIFYLEENKPEY